VPPPALGAPQWPASAYARAALPERVLAFGTGMLLRSLPLALLDAANRAGRAAGRAVLVQSTAAGLADALTAQDGLYTLVERGLEDGRPVERARLVGAVARALVAERDWPTVRALAATPALRAVVSNVTEAGFRAHPDDGRAPADDAAGRAPAGFVGKLAALLHARFRALGSTAPVLLVIPTELVDDNGRALAALVHAAAGGWPDAAAFRAWLDARVRFCASLVDRITTGTPPAPEHAALERALGYRDALATVAEPYALWAVEGDPAELRDALPLDDGVRAVFAPSIAVYRERKLRLLNGAHTAVAPLALLAGVGTVYDAARDAAFGALLRRLLFDEIAPATALGPDDARAFARAVLDRFGNPALAHAWRVIAGNQTAKLRARVAPVVRAYGERFGVAPPGLALGLAGALVLARGPESAGRDPEAPALARHWAAAGAPGAGAPNDDASGGGAPAAGAPDRAALARVAASALGDAALWGGSLAGVPGLVPAVTGALAELAAGGARAAVERLAARGDSGGASP
jgi:tagaturonate reductase